MKKSVTVVVVVVVVVVEKVAASAQQEERLFGCLHWKLRIESTRESEERVKT
jgi:hypothetical protein